VNARKWVTPFAVAGVAAGGWGARLWLAWRDITALLVRFVPDDSFFVFRIARNLAAGQGLTFDGVIPANSPRLLWESLLALVFLVIPANDELAANAILTLGATADAVTVVLLFFIMRELGEDATTAVFTAGIYAFMPYAIRQAINGLETALAVALLAGVYLWYIKLTVRGVRATAGPWYALGLCGGVILLTRLDYGLWSALLFCDLLRRPGGRRPALWLAAGTATLLGPWVLFSWLGFHELLPSSGYAATYTYYMNYFVNHTPSVGGFLSQAGYYFFKAFKYYAFPFVAIRLAYAGPIAFVALVAGTVIAYARGDRGVRAKFRLLLLPMAMVLVLLVVHGFILWYAREWHTGPSLFATALLGGGLFAFFTRKLGARTRAFVTAAAALALLLVYVKIAQRDWRAEAYKPFINHYRVAVWARDHLPPSAVIGSFDGGVPGYFSHRRVVDLVGVENKRAFAAVRGRRLGAYLDEEGIEYLHLMPCRTDPYYGWFWGEDITKRLEGPLFAATEPGVQPDMRTAALYRVTPRRRE